MKKTQITYKDLGTIDYKQAWDIQEDMFQQKLKKKLSGELIENHLFFCEHNNVYTLGKSGTANNLLINDSFLKSINARYYKTNRGGDITYHGEGQLVGYPIIDVENFNLGVRTYVEEIENSIIEVLKEFNINSSLKPGATGVWLDVSEQNERKICAIGVKLSRGITMHGFALNVNTDLSYFNHINPCGFVNKGVTSMQKELSKAVDITKVKNIFQQKFLIK